MPVQLLESKARELFETDQIDKWTLYDYLRECEEVSNHVCYQSRWWNEHVVVVKIDNKFIQYMGASSNGDWTPRDQGWEFEINSIDFVYPTEVKVIQYLKKGEQPNV